MDESKNAVAHPAPKAMTDIDYIYLRIAYDAADPVWVAADIDSPGHRQTVDETCELARLTAMAALREAGLSDDEAAPYAERAALQQDDESMIPRS